MYALIHIDYSDCQYCFGSTYQWICNSIISYRIAQNFGGKKHWRIWRMKLHPPMFFPPII